MCLDGNGNGSSMATAMAVPPPGVPCCTCHAHGDRVDGFKAHTKAERVWCGDTARLGLTEQVQCSNTARLGLAKQVQRSDTTTRLELTNDVVWLCEGLLKESNTEGSMLDRCTQ